MLHYPSFTHVGKVYTFKTEEKHFCNHFKFRWLCNILETAASSIPSFQTVCFTLWRLKIACMGTVGAQKNYAGHVVTCLNSTASNKGQAETLQCRLPMA